MTFRPRGAADLDVHRRIVNLHLYPTADRSLAAALTAMPRRASRSNSWLCSFKNSFHDRRVPDLDVIVHTEQHHFLP